MYATLIQKLNEKLLILSVIFSQDDPTERVHEVFLILDVFVFTVDYDRHCPLNYFAMLGCGNRDALAGHASCVFGESYRSCYRFVFGLGVMRRGGFVGLAGVEGLLVEQIGLLGLDSVRILEHANHA